MYIGRKLLILAVVLLFSYIIYSLLQKRRTIISAIQEYQEKKEKEKYVEGFGEKDDPNYDAIMKDIKNISSKITYQIDNDNKPVVYKNYNRDNITSTTKIKDVFTKASYNSAFTGNYLSNEMVKFCLSQGCRFLDFEVDVSNNIPMVVCKNRDNTNKTKSGTPDGISFTDVLKTTLDTAFTQTSGVNYPITNADDPLFIHIRCSKSDYDIVYNHTLTKLANDVHYKQYLMWNGVRQQFVNINPANALLSECNKKAFIILCTTDNKSSSSNTKYSNYSYDIRDSKIYSSINPKTSFSKNEFEIVLSDPTELDEIKPNPDVFVSVKNHGYTVTCISYYNYFKEAYLTQNERKYENMFIDFNYSFILMKDLQNYISTNPLYVK